MRAIQSSSAAIGNVRFCELGRVFGHGDLTDENETCMHLMLPELGFASSLRGYAW